MTVIGGYQAVDQGKVRPQYTINICEFLVETVVVVCNAALLMHESELVLDRQSHLGHAVSFELGQGEIEVFFALFDELFQHEGRDIDEFFQTLQEDWNCRCFVKKNRYGACFPADAEISSALEYQYMAES